MARYRAINSGAVRALIIHDCHRATGAAAPAAMLYSWRAKGPPSAERLANARRGWRWDTLPQGNAGESELIERDP